MSRFPNLVQHFLQEDNIKLESPGRPAPVHTEIIYQQTEQPKIEKNQISNQNTNKNNLSPSRTSNTPISSTDIKRLREFNAFLSTSVVDLDKIRQISWSGIPSHHRARVWRLFLDYEPTSIEQAPAALSHKRKDYFDCMKRLFSVEQRGLWTSTQRQAIHQIEIDLPRTLIALLHDVRVISLFRHVLFVWAVRHPASSYVQGMNDILQPFFFIFIQQYYPDLTPKEIIEKKNIDDITNEQLADIEADCFWCFSRLLDGIQDVFTKDQPGLYRMIDNLQKVVQKEDANLAKFISDQGIPYTDFTIRWMGCLFVRDFHLEQLFRIWDLFISDPTKIAMTQVYICAAMLVIMSDDLMRCVKTDFIMTIQSITPDYWTMDKVESVLALSYVYQHDFPLNRSNTQNLS